MKQKLKTNKGITLIALIITIIVLLILVTVSINIALNEGIIKRAQDTVNKYNEAQTNELEKLNEVIDYMDGLSENKPSTSGDWWKLTATEEEELKDNINGDGTSKVTVIANDGKYAMIGLFYPYIPTSNVGINIVATGETYVYTIEDTDGMEKNKWYKSGETAEYTGPCPISKENFAEGTIYCESYLDRVIASFNK